MPSRPRVPSFLRLWTQGELSPLHSLRRCHSTSSLAPPATTPRPPTLPFSPAHIRSRGVHLLKSPLFQFPNNTRWWFLPRNSLPVQGPRRARAYSSTELKLAWFFGQVLRWIQSEMFWSVVPEHAVWRLCLVLFYERFSSTCFSGQLFRCFVFTAHVGGAVCAEQRARLGQSHVTRQVQWICFSARVQVSWPLHVGDESNSRKCRRSGVLLRPTVRHNTGTPLRLVQRSSSLLLCFSSTVTPVVRSHHLSRSQPRDSRAVRRCPVESSLLFKQKTFLIDNSSRGRRCSRIASSTRGAWDVGSCCHQLLLDCQEAPGPADVPPRSRLPHVEEVRCWDVCRDEVVTHLMVTGLCMDSNFSDTEVEGKKEDLSKLQYLTGLEFSRTWLFGSEP